VREAYGVPVVERADDLPRVVAELGIVPWKRVGEPEDLDEYRHQLANPPVIAVRNIWPEEEGAITSAKELQRLLMVRRAELDRFAPRAQALLLIPPGGGKTGAYFRSVGKNWVAVFATVPDPDPDRAPEYREQWFNLLVPIVAEWKHGAEVTVIGPVYGVLEKGESPRDCALREFREETGFELADVMPLTADGLAVSPRQSTQQYFPFLGRVKEPITRGTARLDATEHLKLVFVRLRAWVYFISNGLARDDNAYATTFLALAKMGLLQVGYPPGRGLTRTV